MCDILVPYKRISAHAHARESRVHRVTQCVIASETRYVCNDIYRDTHRACACLVRVCWMPFIFSCNTHSSPHARGSKSLRPSIVTFFPSFVRYTRRESPTRGDPDSSRTHLYDECLNIYAAYATRMREGF